MKCAQHPEVEADVLCALCKSPICQDCRINLRDNPYCRNCLEQKIAGTEKPETTGRSRFLVLLLSLIPGGGYMFLGHMRRGLQAMIIFFGTIFVASVTNLNPLIPLVLPVLMFYSIFDSLQLAGKANEGIAVQDIPLINVGERNWRGPLGWGLVGLGIVALLNNYLPHLLGYGILRDLLPPALLIAAGVIILFWGWRGDANAAE